MHIFINGTDNDPSFTFHSGTILILHLFRQINDIFQLYIPLWYDSNRKEVDS